MSVKLKDLATKLDSSVEELQKLLREWDFTYDEKKLTVDSDIAELLEDELGTTKSSVEKLAEQMNENLERDIIKKQRKKTAGKDTSKKTSGSDKNLKVDILEIGDAISVKELAEKTGVSAAKIIGELMKNGILANINQLLDYDTVAVMMSDFGVQIKRKSSEGSADDFLSKDIDAIIGEEDSDDLSDRPAIITVMGHVDHGKTKLLDTIRNADVVSGESGGITQHIAAYQVTRKGKKITFLDTPGHEAFTEMRSRGAKVTDIAILVVSATEGVKPTTIEAINHAKEAGVPIVVAINKMDLPEANPEKVKSELVEFGLQSEDWGGDTIMVPISALKGEGIDQLLDMILVVSEMQELKANPDRKAVATVVETHMEPGLGAVATVVVNTGTLKVGDPLIAGDAYGKVKAMWDDKGDRKESAGPATPVVIAGLSKTPQAGDIVQVMDSEKNAREQAVQVEAVRRDDALNAKNIVGDLVRQIQSGELKVLKVVLKTDTKGSFEAIKQSLEGIKHDEVMVKVIHSGVGDITESDVMMASASNALLLGFHVGVSQAIERSAEQRGVDIKIYKIIYKMIEDITRILSGLLEPEEVVVEHGTAKVKEVFFTKKSMQIVGLKVETGKLVKGTTLRVFRNDEQIGEGTIQTLKRVDKDVDEMKAGNDCGIQYTGQVLLEAGDKLECYEIEMRERSL
jgi:translation initiation factor IF-2